jgi:ubiquinol-cytochrome c reductase cytochrome c1 subunit
MVRIIGFFVGLAFAGVLLISLFVGVSEYFSNPPAPLAASEFHKEPRPLHLASDGPFGKFDTQQLQRGFQVYSEVCKACHSLKLVAFGDLKQIGYDDAEVKAIAAQWDVPDVNPDTGEPSTRKGIPADHFPSPFANDVAARAANNNAIPPDLSDIVKAREGGAAYVRSLLTGFTDQATYRNEKGELLLQKFPDAKTPPNLHFNPYFANLNIAMPPPLTSDGQVTYAPGNPKPTVDQMAQDVAAFLVWTSEPNLPRRHAAGVAVVVFLLFGTILAFLAYHNVWDEAHRVVRVTGPLEPKNQAKARGAKRKAGVAG